MTNTWATWEDDDDSDDDDELGYDELDYDEEECESPLLTEINRTIHGLANNISMLGSSMNLRDTRSVDRWRLRAAQDLAETRRWEEALVREFVTSTLTCDFDLPAQVRFETMIPNKGVRKKLRAIALLTDACAARLVELQTAIATCRRRATRTLHWRSTLSTLPAFDTRVRRSRTPNGS